MLPASNPDLHPLIRKLESIAPVSDDERGAIAALPITVRDLKADADIVRDQDRPSSGRVVIEDWGRSARGRRVRPHIPAHQEAGRVT